MNENYLTLCPHVMKLSILAYKTYYMELRREKTALIVSVDMIRLTAS